MKKALIALLLAALAGPVLAGSITVTTTAQQHAAMLWRIAKLQAEAQAKIDAENVARAKRCADAQAMRDAKLPPVTCAELNLASLPAAVAPTSADLLASAIASIESEYLAAVKERLAKAASDSQAGICSRWAELTATQKTAFCAYVGTCVSGAPVCQ